MADEPTGTPGASPPSTEPEGGAKPPESTTTTPTTQPGDQLGDAGKRALDAERSARSQAEAALKKTQGELEKLRQAQMSEQEKAVEAARQEGRTEATAKADARLVRAEVIGVAAGRAADPGDVVAILESAGKLKDLEVGDDGSVDRKAIETMIGDLLKEKPHLAAVRAPGFGTRTPANGDNSSQDMNAWLRQSARR